MMEMMVPADLPHWMWLAALIVSVVIAPTVLAWMNNRSARDQRQQLEQIRHQVENDHDKNLRDELDERHTQIVERLDTYASCLSNIAHSLGSLDRRTKRIGEEVIRDREDLDRLRKDSYDAIRRGDRIIAKHHPDE